MAPFETKLILPPLALSATLPATTTPKLPRLLFVLLTLPLIEIALGLVALKEALLLIVILPEICTGAPNTVPLGIIVDIP